MHGAGFSVVAMLTTEKHWKYTWYYLSNDICKKMLRNVSLPLHNKIWAASYGKIIIVVLRGEFWEFKKIRPLSWKCVCYGFPQFFYRLSVIPLPCLQRGLCTSEDMSRLFPSRVESKHYILSIYAYDYARVI